MTKWRVERTNDVASMEIEAESFEVDDHGALWLRDGPSHPVAFVAPEAWLSVERINEQPAQVQDWQKRTGRG